MSYNLSYDLASSAQSLADKMSQGSHYLNAGLEIANDPTIIPNYVENKKEQVSKEMCVKKMFQCESLRTQHGEDSDQYNTCMLEHSKYC